MKIFLRIIVLILISLNLFIVANNTFAAAIEFSTTTDKNLNTGVEKSENTAKNDHLGGLKTDNDYDVNKGGGEAAYDTIVTIAKSLKNVFFYLASIYFVILVIKLLFTEKTDEGIEKFKKGIIWISFGLIITQISYSAVNSLYGQSISEGLAYRFTRDIIYPIIELLETGAAFIFIAIALFSFFRMITANGNEEKVKEGRMSVIYSIIGYIVIKLARVVIDTIYGKINCYDKNIGGIISISSNECIRESDLSGFAQTVVRVIDWANSFIGIIVIILIIYTGVQVILNVGDDERLKKAKNTILYIVLGLFLLFVNYLILTFFLIPEKVI